MYLQFTLIQNSVLLYLYFYHLLGGVTGAFKNFHFDNNKTSHDENDSMNASKIIKQWKC